MDIAAASEEISPYDRLYWPDEQLRHCLATGEQRRELTIYLGADAYVELSALARAAATAVRVDAGPRVCLVPGIMGSQLGIPRAGGAPPDIIWPDPIDMIRGDLYKLALTTASPVRALGLVHHSYLRLWLRLLAAGFDVRPFAYDWRHDILQLGAALAQAIIAEQQPVMLIAHSLGGLVARAALLDPLADASVSRVVQLGVPNKGAVAALLALRGCYPVVQRSAMLDRRHSAEQLARDVFATFASVQQLRPDNAGFWRTLPPADARYRVIAGIGQVTCDAVIGTGEEPRFRYSRAGDGTVSIDSARLENAPCYLTRTEHSDLSRDPAVTATVIDLLRDGHSSRLPRMTAHEPLPISADLVRIVSASELSPAAPQKIDWASWSGEDRRHFLEGLNAPLALPALAGL